MYVSLFLLGLILTAAGGAMVGFGIPINEFGLGNTLIMAGTTAFVGGLLLIGLADAVRQLRRIAESLMARPSPRMARLGETVETSGARSGPGQSRAPFPSKPHREARGQDSTALEQRLAAASSINAADDDFERMAPAFSPILGAPEPRMIPERDEAPLSPQTPAQSRESRFSLLDVVPERRDAGMQSEPHAKETLRTSNLDPASRPASPGGTYPERELFDSFWPAGSKLPEAEGAAVEPHAVSILKSGVVDGMAYTLYSDGSIEAELPQGTVRFASITELRAYLDKSS